MQNLIREMIKMTSPLKADGIKVVGSDTKTELSAVDEGKDLVVYMKPKKPIREFMGTFGIRQLRMLDNLLSHEPYRAQGMEIERFERKVTDSKGVVTDMEVPKLAKFRDGRGGSATFFFSHGAGVVGADYPSIDWHYELEPRKEAIEEFRKLATIFTTEDCSSFRMTLEDRKLKLSFGIEGQTTNHGEMIFEEDVRANLTTGLAWDVNRLISILKTVGTKNFKLAISNHKLLRIVTETDEASYEYWLRCVKPV